MKFTNKNQSQYDRDVQKIKKGRYARKALQGYDQLKKNLSKKRYYKREANRKVAEKRFLALEKEYDNLVEKAKYYYNKKKKYNWK